MEGYGRLLRRVALVATALALGAAPAAHASQLTEIKIPARNAHIADQWLPGYAGPPRARVLLPDNYDPAKRYPLLVLLAGLSSNYRVWSEPGQGQIAKTAAGLGAIIVMPEGGSGWYADWWNKGKRDDPQWETYYVDDVIPYILKHYPIRSGRRWHTLAGVSMGGLGTAYLGGRMPGFFGSIAIISGLVDGHLYSELAPGGADGVYPPVEGSVQSLIPEVYANAGVDPQAVMGPDQGFYSFGHDPVMLADNLRQTRVYMTAGDGTPTDDGQPNPRNVVTDPPSESLIIRPASDSYAAALDAAGVDYTYEPHAGIHDWANFRVEFRDAMQWGFFKPVVEHPTSWINDTVATDGVLWGWRFRFDSPPDRIVRFQRSGDSLSVSAAGSAVTLTTKRGCVVHAATPAVIDLAASRGRGCSEV